MLAELEQPKVRECYPCVEGSHQVGSPKKLRDEGKITREQNPGKTRERKNAADDLYKSSSSSKSSPARQLSANRHPLLLRLYQWSTNEVPREEETMVALLVSQKTVTKEIPMELSAAALYHDCDCDWSTSIIGFGGYTARSSLENGGDDGIKKRNK